MHPGPFIQHPCQYQSSSILANTNPDFRYLEPDGVALPQASFGLGIVIEPGHRLAFLTGRTGSDPDGSYPLGIVIEPGHRLAFLTGRTGSNPDGSYPDDFETQARNALASVSLLLSEAGMDWTNVVKINVYLTDSTDIPVWGRVRDEVVGDSRPSGTGVIVKALAAPGARVEVTVIAGTFFTLTLGTSLRRNAFILRNGM
jgi:enamine deaminase RidA (YjgF/YER057c/UK114 family)